MNEKLRSVNIFSILIHGIIGIRILTIPRDIIEQSGNDAWISILLMYIISMITAYTFYWIATQYRGKNIAEISIIVFGKYFGKLVLTLVIFYTTITIGLSLRLFSYSIKIFLLDKTPDLVIMTSVLILSVYCLYKDVKTLSIVMDILLPVVLIVCVLLVVLPLNAIDPGAIFPVLRQGIIPIAKGSLEIVDPILPVAIIAYIMPYFGEFKKLKKYIFYSITAVFIIYVSITLICLMVFGKEEIKYILFPTLTLTKAIAAKSIIVERAEGFFMIAWIPITFSSLVVNFFMNTLTLKALLNTNKKKLLLNVQAIIFLIIAHLPPSIVYVMKLIDINGFIALTMNLIILPSTVIAVLIKKRREHTK